MCIRDRDWGGEADGVRIFGGFVEEDAGVAVGDDHFQAEQEFCFDFVKEMCIRDSMEHGSGYLVCFQVMEKG